MFLLYLITCACNGKLYVGQTVRSLEKRWYQHRMDSKRGQMTLYRAMRKHGFENFRIEQIGECRTREEASIAEKWLIIFLGSHISKNGYNVAPGGFVFGKRSPDLAAKIKAAWTPEKRFLAAERTRKAVTPESRKAFSELNKKIWTPERRAAASELRLKMSASPEHSQKMKNAWTPERKKIFSVFSASAEMNMKRRAGITPEVRKASGDRRRGVPRPEVGPAVSAALLANLKFRSEAASRLRTLATAKWKDPAFRSLQRKIHTSPEVAQKISASWTPERRAAQSVISKAMMAKRFPKQQKECVL